jgi:toxin CptA
MSFAVSAVIVPSRRLRCLLAAFCASLCAAALAVGLLLPERFVLGGAIAVFPLLAALSLARLLLGTFVTPRSAARADRSGHRVTNSWAILHSITTARQLDISGVGQIRLTVQLDMASIGMPMELVAGATVWPCCMLLRLRAEDGTVRPLVLLPDSLPAGQYRALAVAVRALGGNAGGAGACVGAPNAQIL